MRDYKTLYRDDPRFHRYVDATAESYGRSVEETLELRAVMNVGDYYASTSVKEYETSVEGAKDVVKTVTVVGCGGC